jgi:hypothetical protein
MFLNEDYMKKNASFACKDSAITLKKSINVMTPNTSIHNPFLNNKNGPSAPAPQQNANAAIAGTRKK